MQIGDHVEDLFGNLYSIKKYSIECIPGPLYNPTNVVLTRDRISNNTLIIVGTPKVGIITKGVMYNIHWKLYILLTLEFIEYNKSKDIRYG